MKPIGSNIVQGRHTPCAFLDRQFICLTKINKDKRNREKNRKKEKYIHGRLGFGPKDPESFCAT
jgi:hypothetical protein